VQVFNALNIKINGFLAGATIVFHMIFTDIKKLWKKALWILASSVASFFVMMTLFEYIINLRLVNPFERLIEIINLSRKLTYGNTNNEFLSKPI